MLSSDGDIDFWLSSERNWYGWESSHRLWNQRLINAPRDSDGAISAFVHGLRPLPYQDAGFLFKQSNDCSGRETPCNFRGINKPMEAQDSPIRQPDGRFPPLEGSLFNF